MYIAPIFIKQYRMSVFNTQITEGQDENLCLTIRKALQSFAQYREKCPHIEAEAEQHYFVRIWYSARRNGWSFSCRPQKPVNEDNFQLLCYGATIHSAVMLARKEALEYFQNYTWVDPNGQSVIPSEFKSLYDVEVFMDDLLGRERNEVGAITSEGDAFDKLCDGWPDKMKEAFVQLHGQLDNEANQLSSDNKTPQEDA